MFGRDAIRATLVTAAACSLLLLLSAADSYAQLLPRQEGRIGPPSAITCPRDNLTSFTGRITGYTRRPSQIVLRMRTDDATNERFTINYPKNSDPARWFLIRGEEFKEPHWADIESRKGVLKPKMRAIVWVCNDGSLPVIDWRPGEKEGGAIK